MLKNGASALIAKISIKNLIISLVVFFITIGAIQSWFAWESYTLSKDAERRWSEYHARSDRRVEAIRSVVGAFGYGGMIHNFKNYLLRKSEDRAAFGKERSAP